MDELRYQRESVKYNSSLRSGKFQEAVDSLLIMAAINIADNMPNDALRCLVVALCLELTVMKFNGALNLRLMMELRRVYQMRDVIWAKAPEQVFLEVSKSFKWDGIITLVNACVIFQLCINGEYESANALLELLSRQEFIE